MEADACADAITEADTRTGTATAAARGVSTEQLWSALRVDSYFAPRRLPPLRVALRSTALNVYLHNDLPRLNGCVFSCVGVLLAFH